MQASTKRNLIIAACYSATLLLGILIAPKFYKESPPSRSSRLKAFLPEGPDKVSRVLNLIEENYVDPVKADTIEEIAINQILKKLDPHSAYLAPAEARSFSEDLDGNYNGIGIEYQLLNDTVFVTNIHQAGPAAIVGIRPGDRIVKVNQVNIAGPHVTARRIAGLIKGRKGTEVELLVKRRGGLKSFKVKRGKIIQSSIDAAYLLNKATGYIKISKFGARTDEDFARELKVLQKEGIANLILDLRGNGGGYLNAATALADQFLPDKKLIVYTRGEHEPRTDYFSTGKGLFERGKLVILIDENSASASEILAGAIQDLDRGIIVGRRSFGKGLVQEQFNFGDGSALNLTVARYFTPSGRSIQKPYNRGSDKYYEKVLERNKNREVKGRQVDSLNNKQKTYKTASGRVIYGGGGITPDVFVPVDSIANNDLYYQLNARGVISDFVYGNIGAITPPTSLSQLIRDFKVSDRQYKKLLKLASDRQVKFSNKRAEEARQALNNQIKALIARYYFGDEGFYQVKNENDRVIVRALQALKAPEAKAGFKSQEPAQASAPER